MFASLGIYDSALYYYSRCMEINTDIFGPQSEEIEGNSYNIALIYSDSGLYDSVSLSPKQCLTIDKELFGPRSEQTSHILYAKIGQTYSPLKTTTPPFIIRKNILP